jgi:ribosomal protein S18 acetylase RimI-like enzyme
LIFRRAQETDRPALVRLLRDCFNGWHGEDSDDVWRWKFERNPHGKAHVWVADDDGRIAGCYIWNPVHVRLGDQTIGGAQSVDAAVHPDYQGRGLFTDLARTAVEAASEHELAVVFAFPSEGAIRGQLKSGFQPGFSIVKTYRPALAWSRGGRRLRGLTLTEPEAFDSRFAELSNSRNTRLTVCRDPEYLQWRYRDCPTERYETIACEEDGHVCGYCVVRVRQGSSGWMAPGYIIDLQVLPESINAAAFLVHHALRRLREHGARVVISWARAAGPEQEALTSAGFSPQYHKIRKRVSGNTHVDQFIFFWNERILGSAPAAVNEDPQRSWAITPGDADYM